MSPVTPFFSVRTALHILGKGSPRSHTSAPLFFHSLDSHTLNQAPRLLILVGGGPHHSGTLPAPSAVLPLGASDRSRATSRVGLLHPGLPGEEAADGSGAHFLILLPLVLPKDSCLGGQSTVEDEMSLAWG